jgi:N-acetylglutamate synthase-like GNAT family acetyltransferase
MSTVLRAAEPEDANVICEIFRLSILDLCADYYTVDQLLAWAKSFEPNAIRYAIGNGQAKFFIVEVDKRVAGFSVFYDGMVRALYVHPLFAGKGLGAALLNAAEAEARKQGVKKLLVAASNNSQPFYKKQGFKVIADAEYPLAGNLTMHCYTMEKEI